MPSGWAICAGCQRVIWEEDGKKHDGKMFCVLCGPGDKPAPGEFAEVDEMLDEIAEEGEGDES